jgi:hypothetical protein
MVLVCRASPTHQVTRNVVTRTAAFVRKVWDVLSVSELVINPKQ